MHDVKFCLLDFCYRDILKSYIVAVVVPKFDYILQHWCSEVGIDLKVTNIVLCRDNRLIKAVTADLERVGKESGLFGFEIPVKVHLHPTPWTDHDLLNPTHKLKRHEAKLYFQEVINTLYGDETP